MFGSLALARWGWLGVTALSTAAGAAALTVRLGPGVPENGAAPAGRDRCVQERDILVFQPAVS